MTSVARAIQKLLPRHLPSTLATHPGSLYQILSRQPKDGVGQRVHQLRWGTKGFENCYWIVTKVVLKNQGKHGKAWGKLVWRGKLCRQPSA